MDVEFFLGLVFFLIISVISIGAISSITCVVFHKPFTSLKSRKNLIIIAVTVIAQGVIFYYSVNSNLFSFSGDMAYAAGAAIGYLILYILVICIPAVVIYPLLFVIAFSQNKKQHLKNLALFYAIISGPFLILAGYNYYRYLIFEGVPFYGRVVDQHGNAVMDAKIEYALYGRHADKQFKQIKSDAQGSFFIENKKGSGILIQGIYHADYIYIAPTPVYRSGVRVSQTQLDLERNTSVAFGNVYRFQGFSEKNWDNYSEDNPYIFDVWKVIEHQDKVKQDTVRTVAPIDGTIYTVHMGYQNNVKHYERKDVFKKINPEGHLYISCIRDAQENHMDRVDWQVTITPVDGGIQATTDRYAKLAPSDGYVSSIVIEQKVKDKTYKDYLDGQRYYFTTKNNQYYGFLYIDYSPFVREKSCDVNVYYKINLNGARNL